MAFSRKKPARTGSDCAEIATPVNLQRRRRSVLRTIAVGSARNLIAADGSGSRTFGWFPEPYRKMARMSTSPIRVVASVVAVAILAFPAVRALPDSVPVPTPEAPATSAEARCRRPALPATVGNRGQDQSRVREPTEKARPEWFE
jgi:hypothetical protein